jgi:hypothetical protein
MDVREATARYEKWMARHVRIIKPDLVYKHEQMNALTPIEYPNVVLLLPGSPDLFDRSKT